MRKQIEIKKPIQNQSSFEKSCLIMEIKNCITLIEMWQNFQNNPLCLEESKKYAQVKINLYLTKIKLAIGRFEKC